jgi:hypothetical protein
MTAITPLSKGTLWNAFGGKYAMGRHLDFRKPFADEATRAGNPWRSRPAAPCSTIRGMASRKRRLHTCCNRRESLACWPALNLPSLRVRLQEEAGWFVTTREAPPAVTNKSEVRQ